MFTKKILLLGSGELGKEFVIAAKRLGQYVIAADSYNNAPAMQVADEREVINMLDGDALRAVVAKHQPDIIVPEVEAIRTEVLYEFEQAGMHVVPSARAALQIRANQRRVCCGSKRDRHSLCSEAVDVVVRQRPIHRANCR
jgi:phosphoribosylglycinamide formyltransferase 2